MPIQAGVLALQGDYAAHARMLARLDAAVREVRSTADLAAVQCLCMPGGESTTMSLLLDTSGLRGPLREALRPAEHGGGGLPVLATCAGVILLARELSGDSGSRKVHTLRLLDATVDRNAYGRQVESFEAEVQVDWSAVSAARRRRGPAVAGPYEGPLRAVFIRAPRISAVGPQVQVAGSLNDEPVLLRQGNVLAATFHPEIAGDPRLHAALLALVE